MSKGHRLAAAAADAWRRLQGEHRELRFERDAVAMLHRGGIEFAQEFAKTPVRGAADLWQSALEAATQRTVDFTHAETHRPDSHCEAGTSHTG
jgi:hypothetical protein